MSPGGRIPPRFVPTLTEVVQDPAPTPVGAPRTVVPDGAAERRAPLPPERDAQWAAQYESQLVHRVLQRIDAQLESRLREAVQAVIQDQAAHMAARLRIDVETALRDTVSAALASELGQQP